MRALAAVLLCALAGCALPVAKPRGGAAKRVPGLSGAAAAPGRTPSPSRPRSLSLSGLSALDLPSSGGLSHSSATAAPAGAQAAGAVAGENEPQAQAAAASSLPLESRGKQQPGGAAAPSGSSAQAPAAGSAPAGGPAAAADAGDADLSPADASADAQAPDGAVMDGDAGGAAPAMDELDHDAINKLLDNRLDIGGYRVQIATAKDFSGQDIVFDKTYDIMQDINLFNEFKAAGVNIDRSAYWVRIAFIDLLQFELPWTKARLYGLNKKRLDEAP